MRCRHCGKEIGDQSLFCRFCGTPTNASHSKHHEEESHDLTGRELIDAQQIEQIDSQFRGRIAGYVNSEIIGRLKQILQKYDADSSFRKKYDFYISDTIGRYHCQDNSIDYLLLECQTADLRVYNNLFDSLKYGLTGETQHEEAIRILKIAVSLGDLADKQLLASYYLLGTEGLNADPKKAIVLLEELCYCDEEKYRTYAQEELKKLNVSLPQKADIVDSNSFSSKAHEASKQIDVKNGHGSNLKLYLATGVALLVLLLAVLFFYCSNNDQFPACADEVECMAAPDSVFSDYEEENSEETEVCADSSYYDSIEPTSVIETKDLIGVWYMEGYDTHLFCVINNDETGYFVRATYLTDDNDNFSTEFGGEDPFRWAIEEDQLMVRYIYNNEMDETTSYKLSASGPCNDDTYPEDQRQWRKSPIGVYCNRPLGSTYIYEEASELYDTVGTLFSEGEPALEISSNENWIKVKLHNTIGYVLSSEVSARD